VYNDGEAFIVAETDPLRGRGFNAMHDRLILLVEA
jgi:hypothetical protein